ncbi:transposase TnpA (Uma4) [Legionella pneumophila]|nr:transposase TnpA (Uma4) [Legionella pneumophila]
MNKTLTKVRCRKIIPLFLKMIQNLKQSPFKSLVALGKTLDSWKEEIACMWRFSKSNGITEGFHRKMKTNTTKSLWLYPNKGGILIKLV